MRGGGVSQTYKENNIVQKSPTTSISEYSSLLSLSSAIFLLFLRGTICSLTKGGLYRAWRSKVGVLALFHIKGRLCMGSTH
jgi:hypothetical protein